MHRCVRLASIVFAWVVIAPSAASAQASIAGVVKDTSGAVLPGVTVEAASPALIEKMRSVVSDGTGQYRIENLRPGVYTVTFTLTGFNTVKREGIELAGSFTASVNADLRVGALEETITVTGETPVVDVRSTTRQRVLDQQIIDALPMGRAPSFMIGLLAGVTTTQQDVGGITGDGSQRGRATVHGNQDARVVINGLSNHKSSGSTSASGAYNIAAYQEMAVDTGGIGAEQKEGGVRINMIPRDGGNTFRTYFYGVFANHSMQGNNFTQDLKDAGLGTPDRINKIWDLNPAVGGPIVRDKVWFHATARYDGAYTFVPMFFNKNAGNPNAWTYEADTSKEAAGNQNSIKNLNARVTWQATPKHKIAFTYDPTHVCDCPRGLVATRAPEANLANYVHNNPDRQLSADWTAPLTNRLLFEAVALTRRSFSNRPDANLFAGGSVGQLNAVTEQSTGITYRGTADVNDQGSTTAFWRAAMSYITGAHAVKVGFNYGWASSDEQNYSIDSSMSFRFNNGVPNRLTLLAFPFRSLTTMNADHGLFIQDKWTLHRLTLSGGLRYDYFHLSYPDTPIGPGPFAPNRNFVLPAADGVRWHELEPRSGLAYDVFGDGKTAVKVSLNKYLAAQSAGGASPAADLLSPVHRLVTSTNRSWTDRNNNFIPDCDLLNPAAQTVVGGDICGAMDNPGFGTLGPDITPDPNLLSGWGKRDHNWQFSTGVQREIVPRVSVDVSYFRTWFGNFLVTDDRAISVTDFDRFSITAPSDPRLPDGGGYVVSDLQDLKPAAFGRTSDKYLTFADNYGKQYSHWNGVDIWLNARPRPGLTLQGGTSTGRTTTDNCEVLAKVPELNPLGGTFCHQQGVFITQFKLLGTYTVPRIDVLVSGTFQSIPGPQILANYTATNAVVSPSLGRSLSGGSNVVVSLVAPGALYGERLNQLDFRFGKVLRFGRGRATATLDVYNALNRNPVVALSSAFATWLRPQQILPARFAKVGIQVEF
jgi:hypothetical protein